MLTDSKVSLHSTFVRAFPSEELWQAVGRDHLLTAVLLTCVLLLTAALSHTGPWPI
jgi:hypothetical protein